jgi:hypothetical protein
VTSAIAILLRKNVYYIAPNERSIAIIASSIVLAHPGMKSPATTLIPARIAAAVFAHAHENFLAGTSGVAGKSGFGVKITGGGTGFGSSGGGGTGKGLP